MKSNKSIAIVALPLTAVLLGVIGFLIWGGGSQAPVYNGIVDATQVDVAAKIAGRIDSLYVLEGDKIQKGDTLARLTGRELDAKLRQTQALMEQAKYKYIMAGNGARTEERQAVKNMLDAAKHQFVLAEKTYKRMMSMYKDSLISKQDMDTHEFRYLSAKEQMEAAQAKFDMVQAGVRFEELRMAQELFNQAQGGVDEVQVYHDELILRAPVSGEIVKRIVNPGEIASAGYPVFTILQQEDSWITLTVKETELQQFTKGTKHKGTVPALGDKQITCEVVYVSAMGDFANWRPTNQKGGFDIKTFEVRLRPETPVENLRPGMTVQFISTK